MERADQIGIRPPSRASFPRPARRSRAPSRRFAEALLADWWREKEETASREYMDRLRAKYGVELDDRGQSAARSMTRTQQGSDPMNRGICARARRGAASACAALIRACRRHGHAWPCQCSRGAAGLSPDRGGRTRRVQRPLQDAHAGRRCGSTFRSLFSGQGREPDAGRLPPDRGRDGPDLAHPGDRAARRPVGRRSTGSRPR